MLRADDYYISYSSTTKNATIVQEKLAVSRAMTPCGGTQGAPLSLPYNEHTSLENILQSNIEPFLEYLFHEGVFMNNRTNVTNHSFLSYTTLRVPSKCYNIDFNDSYITIQSLN